MVSELLRAGDFFALGDPGCPPSLLSASKDGAVFIKLAELVLKSWVILAVARMLFKLSMLSTVSQTCVAKTNTQLNAMGQGIEAMGVWSGNQVGS